jgi:hypothetical protein
MHANTVGHKQRKKCPMVIIHHQLNTFSRSRTNGTYLGEKSHVPEELETKIIIL